MNLYKPIALISSALGFLFSDAGADAITESAGGLVVNQIEIMDRTQLRFPGSMQAIGITEGTVSLVLEVDSNGNTGNAFILESTRPEFTKSALKSVKEWTFTPASYDSIPIDSSIQIDLDFSVGEQISWQFVAIGSSNVPRTEMIESPVTSSDFTELDSIPLPLDIVEPDPKSEGFASIEFYIDETGNVRGPRLISGSSLAFCESMLGAVTQWKFESPVVAGHSTNTLVRQHFSVVNGKLSASVH